MARIKAAIWMVLALTFAASTPVAAQPARTGAEMPRILSLRERARLQDQWLARRLETLVPRLMRENRVDMWILIAREYLEDPVMTTMLDARSMRARRRTILVFFDPGGDRPVERLTVSRYGMAGLFAPSWNPESQPDQWRRLAEIVAERDPQRIAINVSGETAFADGLTHSQYEALMAVLPAAMRRRIVSDDDLAVGWLETRIAEEMSVYPSIVRIAHAIIAEGFSRRAVSPGRTTVEDLEWWFRERINRLDLDTWFHTNVAIFRRGAPQPLEGDTAILPGDMLWVDFGVTYLGLNTDTQQLAYVLRPGERDAPAGLRGGLDAANRVQDAVIASFATGRSGNDVLAAARARAIAAGLDPTIYSHPLGAHGHGAGPSIGFWDNQAPDPRGVRTLRPNTAWSIELSARHAVPEWDGQQVDFRLEEDAWFDGESVDWLDGRQTGFHLIRP